MERNCLGFASSKLSNVLEKVCEKTSVILLYCCIHRLNAQLENISGREAFNYMESGEEKSQIVSYNFVCLFSLLPGERLNSKPRLDMLDPVLLTHVQTNRK